MTQTRPPRTPLVTYATLADIEKYNGKPFGSDELVTDTLVEGYIKSVTAQVHQKITGNYVVPVVEERSPLSYAALKVTTEYGVMRIVWEVRSTNSGGLKSSNPWTSQFRMMMDSLSHLPDAEKVSIDPFDNATNNPFGGW